MTRPSHGISGTPITWEAATMRNLLRSALGAATLALTTGLALGDTTALPQAAPGVTALSGLVLDTAGKPLENVLLVDEPVQARTDAQGHFVLSDAPEGDTVLTIDGRHAGPKGSPADHGLYKVRVTLRPGATTMLPFTSYLPTIDHAADVTIPSPTTAEVVVKSKAMPGAELRIPAGTVIRDADNKPVTRIGLTAFPAGRAPFPLPAHLDVGGNFTIQPGGACVMTLDGKLGSVQLRYPNTKHELPKARATFFRYDVKQLGWTAYGIGAVGTDGQQFVPDAATVLHDFDGECPPPKPRVDMSRHWPQPAATGGQ